MVLLKLLVLEEEREMFGLPMLLLDFSFVNGLVKKTRDTEMHKCFTKELD